MTDSGSDSGSGFDDTASGAWSPKPYDLRASAGNDRTHAFLAWQRKKGLEGRMIGYRRAAEILASEMLDRRKTRDIDTVVFPFAACWRHYIELRLKSLIMRCQRLLHDTIKPAGGHNIRQLWSVLRPLLAQAYPGEGPQTFSVVEAVLHQLADMDPRSQDFRYAERTDKTPTLADVDYIDVKNFHEAMLVVADHLEAADSAIARDQDAKNEESYYRWELQQEHEQNISDLY